MNKKKMDELKNELERLVNEGNAALEKYLVMQKNTESVFEEYYQIHQRIKGLRKELLK